MKRNKHRKQTDKNNEIKYFLDASREELINYVSEQYVTDTITQEMKDFLLNDIDNIFNYMYSKL